VGLFNPEHIIEGTVESFFVPTQLKPALFGYRLITGFLQNRIEAHYRRQARHVAFSTEIGMIDAWGKGIAASIPHIHGTITDTATPALRSFRNDLNKLTKEYVVDAAERLVLPVAKRRAPGSIGSSLVVRGGRRPYLTTTRRGARRQVVGLLEFGGTVRAEILPKKRKALMLGPGQFVARVTTPRHYKGQHFMGKAAEDRAQAMAEEVGRKLAAELQRRLNGSGSRISGTTRF
jgi:hypothetical protein